MYTTKTNLDDFFTCYGCKSRRHFSPSCSEVNSTGYSEFDEPSSAHVIIIIIIIIINVYSQIKSEMEIKEVIPF